MDKELLNAFLEWRDSVDNDRCVFCGVRINRTRESIRLHELISEYVAALEAPTRPNVVRAK
jgi:hypothetical protein